jgi:DNA anti-recombination protein RmuC
METIASKDPRAHTANVRNEFRQLIDHLRGDINKIAEPKAQALFETAAEVISGLDTPFKHYEEKSENAWK